MKPIALEHLSGSFYEISAKRAHQLIGGPLPKPGREKYVKIGDRAYWIARDPAGTGKWTIREELGSIAPYLFGQKRLRAPLENPLITYRFLTERGPKPKTYLVRYRTLTDIHGKQRWYAAGQVSEREHDYNHALGTAKAHPETFIGESINENIVENPRRSSGGQFRSGRDLHYAIDLDERGEFRAHVENENGKMLFEIDGYEIFEDGFMKHTRDIVGLSEYLISLGIMEKNDSLTQGAGTW